MARLGNTRESCSIPDCDRPMLARGLCATHYQRVRRAEADKKEPDLDKPVQHYNETPCIAMGVRMPKEELDRFMARAKELDRSMYNHQYETIQAWLKRSDGGAKPSKSMRDFVRLLVRARAHDSTYIGQIRVSKDTVTAIERAAQKLETSPYAVIRGIYVTEGI